MVRDCTTRQTCETRTLTTAQLGGQDKSRSLRRGRTVGECRHIKHFVRGATAHDSLPPETTHWRFDANRTSRASAP